MELSDRGRSMRHAKRGQKFNMNFIQEKKQKETPNNICIKNVVKFLSLILEKNSFDMTRCKNILTNMPDLRYKNMKFLYFTFKFIIEKNKFNLKGKVENSIKKEDVKPYITQFKAESKYHISEKASSVELECQFFNYLEEIFKIIDKNKETIDMPNDIMEQIEEDEPEVEELDRFEMAS